MELTRKMPGCVFLYHHPRHYDYVSFQHLFLWSSVIERHSHQSPWASQLLSLKWTFSSSYSNGCGFVPTCICHKVKSAEYVLQMWVYHRDPSSKRRRPTLCFWGIVQLCSASHSHVAFFCIFLLIVSDSIQKCTTCTIQNPNKLSRHCSSYFPLTKMVVSSFNSFPTHSYNSLGGFQQLYRVPVSMSGQ